MRLINIIIIKIKIDNVFIFFNTLINVRMLYERGCSRKYLRLL